MSSRIVEFPQSLCRVGVSRTDITPPVGIYHRMWGAATHDRSTGVHRPLTATVLALSPADENLPAPPVFFIAVDHCLLWQREMSSLLASLSSSLETDADRIVVFFSHTHAAGLMGREREEFPGGELIGPYLDDLAEKLAEAADRARDFASLSVLSYGTGHCRLAANRDYFDRERGGFVCGFNPDKSADDTVLAVRITNAGSGNVTATLVNYACHPTTLAWENTLISPDYPGAMREVVEGATGAPCFFIQGASGDVGPREGFVGDVSVADRNGRQLGYAALSALEGLPTAGKNFAYAGAVVSGATIGCWRFGELEGSRQQAVRQWAEDRSEVALAYRDDLPSREQLSHDERYWTGMEQAALDRADISAAREARAMLERVRRRLTRLEHIPAGSAYRYPIRIWKLGDAVWIALDGEHYNMLQTHLRERFAGHPLVIGTLANGSSVWYLPDAESYGKGLYQEEASILAKGSLEKLIAALEERISILLKA